MNVLIGQCESGLLYKKGERQTRTSRQANHPEESEPRTCVDIVATHWSPASPCEDCYCEHTADDRTHYVDHSVHWCCLAYHFRRYLHGKLYGYENDEIHHHVDYCFLVHIKCQLYSMFPFCPCPIALSISRCLRIVAHHATYDRTLQLRACHRCHHRNL